MIGIYSGLADLKRGNNPENKAKGILGDLSDMEVLNLRCLLNNLPNAFLNDCATKWMD